MAYIDIIIPNNNEQSFIKIGEKLGYDSLCFVYSFKDYKKNIEKINKLQEKTKIKLKYGIVCDYKSIQKASKISNLCLFDAGGKDNSIIRKVFENNKFDLVFNLEINNKNEHTHFVNSGLDQVLCRLARKKDKIVCFNFNSLLYSKDFQRSRLIARMTQNIRFCRKFKVKIAMVSFATNVKEMRYYHDLIGFLIALKTHPSKAKKALKVVYDKIKLNEFKKSDKFVINGVVKD